MQPITLSLTLDEVNTVLEGLGQMPYVRVHLLIAKLQQQASAQLERAEQRATQEDER